MSFEYVTGTITGIIATVAGFILTSLNERRRSKKADRDSRIKIMNLLLNELKDNLEIAEENLKLFAFSLESTKENKRLVIAPTLFHDSSWRMAQASGIALFTDNEVYKFLTETYITMTFMSTQFGARESFRMNNMALSNFNDVLTTYDQVLQERSISTVGVIKQSITKLEEVQQTKKKRKGETL
ncbi:hypothetical protein MUP77_11075 [Candidatus Bathyarchaeota archaeon]|nr:hypothetical protein [Candidatus Bathyarchaeota archaeon]